MHLLQRFCRLDDRGGFIEMDFGKPKARIPVRLVSLIYPNMCFLICPVYGLSQCLKAVTP
jgi:hypothetical protein